MEEKTLITGNFTKVNAMVIIWLVIALISFTISYNIGSFDSISDYLDDAIYWGQAAEGICILFYTGILFLLVAVFFAFEMSFCKIEVTNKRVFGKGSFGKIVDLPYDKISSVGTCFPKGVVVATSSGAIKFWLLSNQVDVYETISNLLKERQNKGNHVEAISDRSKADELKKFKDLLDSGVITQEEFDAKKKQLLGL